MRVFHFLPFVLSLALLLAAPAPARGQSPTATLSGTVVDETGAVVPGVELTALNRGTRTQRRATTDDRGTFAMPLLLPGAYRVTAKRDGFTPLDVPEVVLNVNDQIALRLVLKVGRVGEEVAVVAEPSRVRTSPAVGTVIDRQFVENLPLNGRSFQSLLLLTPGVVLTPGSDSRPGQFSVNGQRTNANYFTVDGVSANMGVSSSDGGTEGRSNQFHAGILPGLTSLGGTQSILSVDALEAFKIQTSTYAAKFGRQPGGQIQFVTRSGTNSFRGSVFESFRDEAFDAHDWFANRAGLPESEYGQHLFGGSFGGPVRLPRFGADGPGWWRGENRTFFFASYEGLRLRLPMRREQAVPSLRLRELAPPALRRLLDGFPLPNGPEWLDQSGEPTGFAPMTATYADPKAHDAISVRLDHVLTRSVQLFGRYGLTPSSNEARNGNFVSGEATTIQTVTLGATMTASPRLTNELRVNYSRSAGRFRSSMDDYGGAVPPDIDMLTTGFRGTGRRQGGILLASPAGMFSSLSAGDDAQSVQGQINIVDTLSWVRGSHLVKLGVDYRHLAPAAEALDYVQSNTFRSEASIRTGVMDNVNIRSSATVRPRFHNVSAYAQDTWKAGERLTLDFGIRWEFNPPPAEASGLTPILVEAVTGADDVANARLAPEGTSLYRTYWTGFAPRVGAAWQLARTPGRETVLRGGFGVYYDLGNGMATTGFNFYPYTSVVDLASVPYPLTPAQAALPPRSDVTLPIRHYLPVMNPDLKLPYTLQWNVSIERSLGASQTVTASYVASAARRLMMTETLNYTSGPPESAPNPDFYFLFLTSNGPTSDYHALQLQYQRRLSRGVQALASYTWSHAIDEVSVENSSFGLARGDADFDVRHNMSAALTYELPSPAIRPLRLLAGGWAVDATVHAQSAAPVDIRAGYLIGPGGSTIPVRPDVVPDVPFYLEDRNAPGGRRINAAAFRVPPVDPATGQAVRQGTLGRNVLRGFPMQQVNFALRRAFRLGGRAELQLRAEAFNLFNRPNFAAIENDLGNASTFGMANTMLSNNMGGPMSLYQMGGARSMQFSTKLLF